MEEIVEMVKWEFFKKLLVEKVEEIGQVGVLQEVACGKVGRNWSSGRIRLASDNAAILLHRAPSAFLQVGIVGMNKVWVPALIIVTSMVLYGGCQPAPYSRTLLMLSCTSLTPATI